MLSIQIYQVGKTKDAELQRMVSDLYKRIGSAQVEEKTFKTEEEMLKLFEATDINGLKDF